MASVDPFSLGRICATDGGAIYGQVKRVESAAAADLSVLHFLVPPSLAIFDGGVAAGPFSCKSAHSHATPGTSSTLVLVQKNGDVKTALPKLCKAGRNAVPDTSSGDKFEIKRGGRAREKQEKKRFSRSTRALPPQGSPLLGMTCLADKTNHPVKRAESQ